MQHRTPRTKNILIVIGSMKSGGAERNASILANQLVERGWKVRIGVVLSRDCFYTLSKSVSFVDFTPKRKKKSPLQSFLKIRRYMKREKPAFVLSFFFAIGSLVQCALPKGHAAPFHICRETGDPANPDRNRFLFKLFDHILRRANRIVFQTPYQKSFYSRALQAKSVVIPNPVGFYEGGELNPTPHSLSCVGRLTELKDFKTAISAFALVKKHYPDASLTIFGDGPDLAALKKQADSLGLKDCVSFPGSVCDVQQRVVQTEVYVHSSLREGLPNALLEAFLSGVPVVTSDWPGYEGILTDGLDCMVYHRKNASELANAILTLFGDPKKRASIIKEAIRKRETYELPRVLNAWEELMLEDRDG